MTFSFRNSTVFACISLLCWSCVPLGEPITGTEQQAKSPEYYAQRTLKYDDHIYNERIRSVQCYAGTGTAEDILTAPVIPLSQTTRAVLEFDELAESQQRFKVKLVHCDITWTPSKISDIQFLNDFNEFFITDARPSGNTKVLYFHYRFVMPTVKLSGNYLLVVLNPDGTYALTRRVLVYDNQVATNLRPVVSAGVSERFTLQQINFDVLYPKYELINPSVEVKVILRQNHRWDNALYGERPTFVHDAQRRLEYSFYEPNKNFMGLNEFRIFDTRSLRYTGFNLAGIDREKTPTEVLLTVQKSRAKEAYVRYPDINGKLLYDNREYGNGNTNGDYAWVNFQVKAKEEPPGAFYIFGQLSDWKLQDNFKLNYDETSQLYTGRALLKQGYYNFYVVVASPYGMLTPYFEGSFADTENVYDLLVYYRPPGTRADLLIGYSSVDVNSNR